MKALKVEYDVYAKLSGNNLINLNLTVCENNKISIFLPIILTGTLDKYNPTRKYYNNICYTTTSKDGTDIILKDRQNEFIDKNLIVCQEDCYFSKYNYDTFKAKCICNVKQCSESFEEMNINKAKILENFKNTIKQAKVSSPLNIFLTQEGLCLAISCFTNINNENLYTLI